MEGFSGFPAGKQRLTSIPNLFFSEILPNVDSLPELKVTLYAFWALSRQERKVRYLRLADFLNDPVFVKGLGATPTLGAEAVEEGVERAVARGTFLHISIEGSDGVSDLYFLNTARGRAAVEGISRGEWRPVIDDEEPLSLLVERPNIFVLYEQNIGVLSPMIAEELRDAEQTYPQGWIEEAIKIAVESNVRRWRYIRSILESWRQEGKQEYGSHSGRLETDVREQILKDFQDSIER